MEALLEWDPADSVHLIEARVTYEPGGTIRSDDPTFTKQLGPEPGEGVLNLNLANAT